MLKEKAKESSLEIQSLILRYVLNDHPTKGDRMSEEEIKELAAKLQKDSYKIADILRDHPEKDDVLKIEYNALADNLLLRTGMTIGLFYKHLVSTP